MVNKNNKRVMITLPTKYINFVEDTCDLEGLSISSYIRELILLDMVERSKKK